MLPNQTCLLSISGVFLNFFCQLLLMNIQLHFIDLNGLTTNEPISVSHRAKLDEPLELVHFEVANLDTSRFDWVLA